MIAKLFDTLANMGIWIRLNDSRREPPTEQGREWGPIVGGFAMSLAVVHGESLSVLIKNVTDKEKRATVRGWLQYLRMEVTGPGGKAVALKAYGAMVMAEPEAALERVFPAGKALAAEIPLGALYEMGSSGEYRARVKCEAPGGVGELQSNEITISKK